MDVRLLIRKPDHRSMKRTEQQIIEDIRKVDSALSVENLTWDGERDPREAERAGRDLRAKRKRLVKELGREPSYDDLYRQVNS